MKPGDLIKFSKEHISSPGHDYVEEWIGVVLEYKVGALNLDPQVSHDRDLDEIQVAWTIRGETHIMEYDELWCNKLDYEPFEVISIHLW